MAKCKQCAQWQELWEKEINLAPHQRGRDISFNDEKIVQAQRKIMSGAIQAQLNLLKSILSETVGPEKVEQLLKDQWQKYYKTQSNPAQSGQE